MVSPCCILNSLYSWINACFSGSLYICGSLMCDFKYVPHFFSRTALRYSEKFIKVQGRGYYIFHNTNILHSLILYISQLITRFLNRHTIHNRHRNIRTIYYNILNITINGFNEDFHSNFPKLVVHPRKHRWPVYRGSLSKRWFILSH